ncbi:hypothetical protein CCO03_08085 [Comamonas serinivorans]|uniref:ABC transporter substrate-binding protein n=1 Tax=Comamonas serinivorans TaxID=1082851 RepID=A0A1Y0ELW0_9BURK|nr:tripartite tricarboxylate transporter substrate binding protein [Comamonas serinivorans]ARU04634.1 hypothetical protein CCO03_08085 [Comamonas serinivorans]
MTTTSSRARPAGLARRPVVQALGLALATVSLGAQAQGQAAADFPSKPIRIVVTYAPGGLTDSMARVLADKMSKSMGVPVLVENKPGAAGIIGTDYVAKSPPDGYTISLALSNAIYTNQFIYPKLPYNPNKDISFIYKLANGPAMLVVHNSVPAKNLEEFKTWLKANPGKINYGSYGIGSYPHMVTEYIGKQLGVPMSHAVYKGEAPMVQDLLSGQIQFAFGSPAVMKPHFETGKLRPIAVTSNKRFATLPDLPTFGEQGWNDKPYGLMGWFGFIGPAGIPKPILDKLAAETRKAMADPDIQTRFVNFGYEAVTDSSPEAHEAEYKRNVGYWKELVQISGAKME